MNPRKQRREFISIQEFVFLHTIDISALAVATPFVLYERVLYTKQKTDKKKDTNDANKIPQKMLPHASNSAIQRYTK